MSAKIYSKTNTLDDKAQKGFSLLNLLNDFAPSESIVAGNTLSQINRRSVSNIEISAKKYESCDTIAVSSLLSTEVLKSDSHINELISNKQEETQVPRSVYYMHQNKSTIFKGVVAKSREKKKSYEQMRKNYYIFAVDDETTKELKLWENLSSVSSYSHDSLSVHFKEPLTSQVNCTINVSEEIVPISFERTVSSGKSIKKKSRPSLNNTNTQTQTRTEINNAIVQVTDSVNRIVMDKSTFFNGKKNRGTKSDSLKGDLQLQSQDAALQCYAVPVTKTTSLSRRKHKLLKSKGTQVKQHKINNRPSLPDTRKNPSKLPSSRSHHKAVPQATILPIPQSPMHRLTSSLLHPQLDSRNHRHFVPKVQNPLQVYLVENTVSSHSPHQSFVFPSPPQVSPVKPLPEPTLPITDQPRTRSSRPPKPVRPNTKECPTVPLKPLNVLPSQKLQKKPPPVIPNKKRVSNNYPCKQCSDLKRSVKTIFQKLYSIAAKPQNVCHSFLKIKSVNNNMNSKNKKREKLQPSNFAQQIETEFKIATVCDEKVVKKIPISIKEDDFQNMVVSIRNPIPTSLQTSNVKKPDLEQSNNNKAEQVQCNETVDISAKLKNTDFPDVEIYKNNRHFKKGNLTIPIEQYNTEDFNQLNSDENNTMNFNGKVSKHKEYSYNNEHDFKTWPQNNSNQNNGKSVKPIEYHYDAHGSDVKTYPHNKLVQYDVMEFNPKVDKSNEYYYNNITELETYPLNNREGHCPRHISNLGDFDYSDYEEIAKYNASEEYFSNLEEFSSVIQDRIIYESETQSDYTSTDIRPTPQSSTSNISTCSSPDDMRFDGGCEGNYRHNRKFPKYGKHKIIRDSFALLRYPSPKATQSKSILRTPVYSRTIGKKNKSLKKRGFQVYNTGPYGIIGSNECETQSNEIAIVKHDGNTRNKLNKLKESAKVTLGEDVFDCLKLDNKMEYLGKDVNDESLPQRLRNFILKN